MFTREKTNRTDAATLLMDECDRAKAAAEIRDKCAQQGSVSECAAEASVFPYDRRFEIVQKQLSEQKETIAFLVHELRDFGAVMRELLKAQGLEVARVPEHLELRKATKPRGA